MWFIHEDDEYAMYLNIVFCKNCRYFNGDNYYCDLDIHVMSDDFCSKGEEKNENDFCSLGERKEE